MTIPEISPISKSTIQELFELTDVMGEGIAISRQRYRGQHGVVLTIIGPDVKAYLQAIERKRELLAEDSDLLDEE